MGNLGFSWDHKSDWLLKGVFLYLSLHLSYHY